MNDWTRISAILPALLATVAACARVTAADETLDAGALQPAIASVEPQPGDADSDAHFVVHFASPMDPGELLATSGRSEGVVLAGEAEVERAAAALSRGHLTAADRALFIGAAATLAPDQLSIELAPDAPLAAGAVFLLVSPRLKDIAGRKLAGGARFAFRVAGSADAPRLLTPPSGFPAPLNLARIRVLATDAGVSLVDLDGGVVSGPVEGPGEVVMPCHGLRAGAAYALSVDGAAVPDAGFEVSTCARKQPPAFSPIGLALHDTAVDAEIVLDWPAAVRVEVNPADGSCARSPCFSAQALIECAADACAPQAFTCGSTLRLQGLAAATGYTLEVVAEDDEGHTSRSALQTFSTLAALPHLILSEVMIDAQPAPRADGQYVEILNQGPGAASLAGLSLVGPDGKARPLLGQTPPLPLTLAPGERALAVGGSFDAARYAGLPLGTPVLRASTHRLLGRGLSLADPPHLDLVASGVVLSSFPGGAMGCEKGQSLQRDESAAADAPAHWGCGKVGGTPGTGP